MRQLHTLRPTLYSRKLIYDLFNALFQHTLQLEIIIINGRAHFLPERATLLYNLGDDYFTRDVGAGITRTKLDIERFVRLSVFQ